MLSSDELERLRAKIEELEGQIKRTKDLAERTAMLNVCTGRAAAGEDPAHAR